MGEIMESIVHGLVFYVFGILFVVLLDLFGQGILNINCADTITCVIPSMIYALPFFLMGFFDKMLD